jgi:hypothetical protein
MKYKIGYIDEDKNQFIKYERVLRKYFDIIGYEIQQGLPIDNLIKQVYESEVDLLMVDYLMNDKGILNYNGDEVARAYEEIMPRFPIVIFTNLETQAFPHVDNPNMIYDKEEVIKHPDHFVEKLTKTIELYKNFIKKRKDILERLIEKGEREGLNASEKHVLLETQIELNALDKSSNEVPLQLLDEKKMDNLSKTTKEAEEFLESLIKKNNK